MNDLYNPHLRVLLILSCAFGCSAGSLNGALAKSAFGAPKEASAFPTSL
jgi:hypothetical protein